MTALNNQTAQISQGYAFTLMKQKSLDAESHAISANEMIVYHPLFAVNGDYKQGLLLGRPARWYRGYTIKVCND